MKQVTDRQFDCLSAIVRRINNDGRPPTIRELCADLGISSTNSVNCFLVSLESKGVISREKNKSRAIKVTDLGMGVFRQRTSNSDSVSMRPASTGSAVNELRSTLGNNTLHCRCDSPSPNESWSVVVWHAETSEDSPLLLSRGSSEFEAVQNAVDAIGRKSLVTYVERRKPN
tara:strand:- start:1722 stop:2237 length:516 start_codon:yes stop_codon:yes gene_type:complete